MEEKTTIRQQSKCKFMEASLDWKSLLVFFLARLIICLSKMSEKSVSLRTMEHRSKRVSTTGTSTTISRICFVGL